MTNGHTTTNDIPDELADLLAALQDGALDPPHRRRLAELLRAHPHAARLYVHLTRLHVLIEEEMAGAATLGIPTDVAPASSRSTPPDDRLPHDPSETAYGVNVGDLARDTPERDGRGLLDRPERGSIRLPVREAGQAPRRAPWRRVGLAAAVFLLGALMAGAIMLAMNRRGADPELAQKPPQSAPTDPLGARPGGAAVLATLTSAQDAAWSGGAPPVPGEELLARPLSLAKGLAELRFGSGATVVVQGPAEFTPETAEGVALRRGRLTVLTRGASAARPFTVVTPATRVDDVGTEFGVDVGDDGTMVRVFAGSVELRAGMAGDVAAAPMHLGAGDARRVDPTGQSITAPPADAVAFVRPAEFQTRLDARRRSSAARWRAFSERFRRDPAMIAYYAFDNATEAPDRLLNRAARSVGKLDGRLRANNPAAPPLWTEGRWPGTGALRFTRTAGHAVVVPDDALLDPRDAVTITAWVQTDSPQSHGPILSRWSGHAEEMPDADEDGGGWSEGATYQLGIIGDAGRVPNSLQFWIGLEPSRTVEAQFSPKPLERSTAWQFLAATFDARTKTKVFYRNGQRLGERAGTQSMSRGVGGLYIGAESPITLSSTSFDGRIAEVAILARVMSDDELRAMYEAGRVE